MEKSNIIEDPFEESIPFFEGASTLRKKKSLTLSVPLRLEALVAVVLAMAVLVFLAMSAHTLYRFPVPDSYRWYGDETWMLLAWKSLLAHGSMTVPIALESTLTKAPGLLLGSSWFTALWYGLPQLLAPSRVDPVSIGRTVTFVFAIFTLLGIGLAGYRLRFSASITTLSMALLATTHAFTFASHSVRYDIITGFAVAAFIAFFAVRAYDDSSNRRRGPGFAFWLGFASLLVGLTVSPHAGTLLFLSTIFMAWYFGAFRNIWNVLSLLAGVVIAFGVLAAAYLAANHHLAVMGIGAGANQASDYFGHLPLLSWSAERQQLATKLYYLWHEAPAFAIALPLIALSEIALLARKQKHTGARFLTSCLVLVLVSAAFFESALPYSLSYYLPLAALTLAAHAREWAKGLWLRPLIAIVSLTVVAEIFVTWLPELNNAGRLGDRIDQANTATIQAAIEEAGREWELGAPNPQWGNDHPLFLAQAPAVHELLRDTTLRVMSESFLFFPLRRVSDPALESPDTLMARAGVNYVMVYNKLTMPEYEAALQRWKPIFSRSGPLLDRAVDYFHDTTSELDTLMLYQR